jgi:hypothetical protein
MMRMSTDTTLVYFLAVPVLNKQHFISHMEKNHLVALWCRERGKRDRWILLVRILLSKKGNLVHAQGVVGWAAQVHLIVDHVCLD